MSKYKVGDKVVMKIISADQDERKTYSVSGVNNNWRWCLPQNLLERYTEPLTAYTEPLEAKIRRQAAEITRLLAENKRLKAENGNVIWEIEQAFDRGCNEAWELVRKIFDMETNDIEDIFIKEDAWNLGTVLNNYTYKEAAAKVAEWEKAKEEIKAGDVFEFTSGGEAVVMKVYEDGEVTLLFPDGGCGIYKPHGSWHKTGRHIDIDGIESADKFMDELAEFLRAKVGEE